jgi:hypothetical protein
MREQTFEVVRGDLLTELERLVVAEHAALFGQLLGERWSRPQAYRWIRYEDPDPIGRLIAASRRLAEEWSRAGELPLSSAARESFGVDEAARLDRALRLARRLGYQG